MEKYEEKHKFEVESFIAMGITWHIVQKLKLKLIIIII